jgi:anti-sigma regulatory factor (Ser/Thr protein kinase)
MTMPASRFDHAALIVESDDTLDRLLLPVLRRHITTREPVLLVVGEHTERTLRAGLGADADALDWAHADAFYLRLGFAFDRFRRFLRRQYDDGRSVHLIAEPDIATDLDAPVDRVAAYLPYEAMCNATYAGFGCPVTCIWDSRRHPTLVIEGVRSIHDHELTEQGRLANRTFIPAPDYLAGRAQVVMPPPPPEIEGDLTLLSVHDLAGGRAVVQNWATTRGFATGAAEQVTTAVNEVLTNGLVHGRPPVRLLLWRHGNTLVVHVEDTGGGAIPPDAGYQPPAGPAPGMGLWITRQFADVVLTRTTPDLTAVRMYFPHALTHRDPDD